MANWSAGYAADVDYTFGYFKELNPLQIRLALLDAGVAPPEHINACELGFGQGVSINIHAAGSKTRWFGTDFSPTQAGFAQEMSHACDNQACLHDQSFAEFAQREDLPEFDFIGLHGTWTWVSDDNRKILVDFIGRKLKLGGVLYISYNTPNGWATMMPIRHLLNQYAHTMTINGDSSVNKIGQAFAFVDQLLDTNPAYLQANPGLRKTFDLVKTQNAQYLAHEYFSDDWTPMHFSDMHAWLSPIKLDYVCSANTLDQVNAINITEAEEAMIADQTNPLFRETVRDICMNQQFRKDLWIKGPKRLDKFEQMEAIFSLQLVLTELRDEVELSANGMLGSVKLKEETYSPILDFFADYQPKKLGELLQAMQPLGIGMDKVMQAMMILTGKQTLQLAQSTDEIANAKLKTDQLNHFLLKKARGRDDITVLASPVTGGGVDVQGYEMLFLLAMRFGHNTPDSIAPFAWGLLKQRGVKLHRNGQWLDTDADNLAELTKQVEFFFTEPLKLYQALGVA